MESAPDSERGFALVGTLSVLAVLAILAGALIETSRLEQRIARNSLAQAQARALAEAGLTLGIKAILDRDPRDAWPLDGTPKTVAYAGSRIEVSIQDELGKVDLNTAPDETIVRVLTALGVNPARSMSLVDALRDWQDEDSLRHAEGAEREDYRLAGFAYGPRNAPLDTLDELEQVKGMSRQLVDRLRPAVTIFSRSAFVDPATAPRDVLLMLADGNARQADDALAQRKSRPEQRASTSRLFDLTARAFTISASVVRSGESRSSQEAVVRFTGNPTQPFWIYSRK